MIRCDVLQFLCPRGRTPGGTSSESALRGQIRGGSPPSFAGITARIRDARSRPSTPAGCSRATAGQEGASGTPEEILVNPDVRRTYLGERYDAGHLLDKIHRHALPPDASHPRAAPRPSTSTTSTRARPRDERVARLEVLSARAPLDSRSRMFEAAHPGRIRRTARSMHPSRPKHSFRSFFVVSELESPVLNSDAGLNSGSALHPGLPFFDQSPGARCTLALRSSAGSNMTRPVS
jgi:hypothetical protein